MANNSSDNIKLGVCKIWYKGTDLGYTKGGVEVEVTTATHPVTIDQHGESVIKEYITKREIKVKVPLAETTIDNLVAIMPGAEKVTTAGNVHVKVKSGVSLDLRALGGELLLRPKALHEASGGIDNSEDLSIPHAGTAGAMKFSYKHDQERIFDCEFMGYPNDSTGVLFTLGDTNSTLATGAVGP